MKQIILAGGGSGGHVTPLRAIYESLKNQSNEGMHVTVISDRRFFAQTKFLFSNHPEVQLKRIYSGKFRRYNSKSVAWHILHLPTLLKNLRDTALIVLGILQTILMFVWNKPDAVFCKGGYVCVPIGIAARIFGIPLIIHDSDTHPGLTNRLLSRWALKIGTGMPKEFYSYDDKKTVYTGIPVNKNIKPASKNKQQIAKKKLGLDSDRPVLFMTGGGTGATFLNQLVSANAETLLDDGWQLVQLTGKGKSKSSQKARQNLSSVHQSLWKIEEFAEVLPYIEAADVVVSRAGATAMQEFANAKKAVILVPNPYLTGGHQLKNAELFAKHDAVKVLQERDLKKNDELFIQTVRTIAANDDNSEKMAQRLYSAFAKPHAADELASLILET